MNAEASERRSSPSRITCRRARSTAARWAASDSVSFLRRLPWWTRWIRAVAFTTARASEVRPFAYFRGFPYSLARRSRVAFTRGAFTGSVCLPRRWAAAIAARRVRAVASDFPSVSTRYSR